MVGEYRLLHQASVHRKHPIHIEIQPPETTNRLLAAAGIGIRDSWGLPAEEMARALQVDAVISTAVQKTRYLSVGESLGVDLGLQVVNEITEGRLAPILPWGLVKSHDIWANCELLDGLDGTLLWQTDFAQYCRPSQPGGTSTAPIQDQPSGIASIAPSHTSYPRSCHDVQSARRAVPSIGRKGLPEVLNTNDQRKVHHDPNPHYPHHRVRSRVLSHRRGSDQARFDRR
ncbi:MAG: hypothetical protein V2I67_01100 [Thermoanaerobaculales bacterium]|nr:hypothetical protein [Thermoanaerobaculales bacterium]